MTPLDTGHRDSADAAVPRAGKDFPSTHWTLVMRVREGGAARQTALEELCGLY